MKVKKFNTILATALLGGGLLAWTALSLIMPTAESSANAKPFSTAMATMLGSENSKEVDGFSEEGKQVINIAWRNYRGQLPEKTSLKKWTVGDRTYYQVSGPINPSFRNKQVDDWQGQWSEYTAVEVFFPRGGKAYDQWLITPNQCSILHFDQGTGPQQGESSLPESRFRTVMKGNRIVTTFWCSKHDTPANIVFNYNQGNGKTRQPLCWASTDERCEENTWVHHVPKWWTYP